MEVSLNLFAEELSVVFRDCSDVFYRLKGSLRIQPCSPRGGVDLITGDGSLVMGLLVRARHSQVNLPMSFDTRGLEVTPQPYSMSMLVEGLATTKDLWEFLSGHMSNMREFFIDNVWEIICEDGFVLISISGPSDLALRRLSTHLGEVYSNAKFELP